MEGGGVCMRWLNIWANAPSPLCKKGGGRIFGNLRYNISFRSSMLFTVSNNRCSRIMKALLREQIYQSWLWLLGLLGGLCVMAGPLNVAKFNQGSKFSPVLREWESVGIWLRPLVNVACLLLLCQGSKLVNGKIVWLRSWVRIPAGSWIFLGGFISHSLSKKHHSLFHPFFIW